MFTYVCLGTNDLARATKFYDAALGALGLARCDTSGEVDWTGWVGWGTYQDQGAREIALWLCQPFDGRPATSGNGTMVALRAGSWREVDAFFAAALASGGTSEGAPGLRPQYNADFYAAYVRDPDGNKLAAVCRGITHPAATGDPPAGSGPDRGTPT
jgi:catechol 2,3-dioxygenase-like lactoylglutathione lyase family enzyme